MFQFDLQFFLSISTESFERTAVPVMNSQLLKSQAFGLLETNIFPLTPSQAAARFKARAAKSCVLPVAKTLVGKEL